MEGGCEAAVLVLKETSLQCRSFHATKYWIGGPNTQAFVPEMRCVNIGSMMTTISSPIGRRTSIFVWKKGDRCVCRVCFCS
jgi:hypothetical protein